MEPIEQPSSFSMPQSTLECIRKMLDAFTSVGLGIYGEQAISLGQAQHLQKGICSQLRVLVAPLLSEKVNK